MTNEEKTNIKYRLSDIGKQVGELALEYISELEKEIEQLKAYESHWDEIEEDVKRIAEENAGLKASLEEKINFYNKQGLKKISEIEELEKENARLTKMLEMAIKEVLLCGKQMKVEHPSMIVWTEETFRAELEKRVENKK